MEIEGKIPRPEEYENIDFLEVNDLLSALKKTIQVKIDEISKLENKKQNDNLALKILEKISQFLAAFIKLTEKNSKKFIEEITVLVYSYNKTPLSGNLYDFLLHIVIGNLAQIINLLNKINPKIITVDNTEILNNLKDQLEIAQKNLLEYIKTAPEYEVTDIANAIIKCEEFHRAIDQNNISILHPNGHKLDGSLFLFRQFPGILDLIMRLKNQPLPSSFSEKDQSTYNTIAKNLNFPKKDAREKFLKPAKISVERKPKYNIQQLLPIQKKMEQRILMLNANKNDDSKIVLEKFMRINAAIKYFFSSEPEFDKMQQKIYTEFKDNLSPIIAEDLAIINELKAFFDSANSKKITKPKHNESEEEVMITDLKKCLLDAKNKCNALQKELGEIASQLSSRCTDYLAQLERKNFGFLVDEGEDGDDDEINKTLFAEFPQISKLFDQLKKVFPQSSIPHSKAQMDLNKILNSKEEAKSSKEEVEVKTKSSKEEVEEDYFLDNIRGDNFVP